MLVFSESLRTHRAPQQHIVIFLSVVGELDLVALLPCGSVLLSSSAHYTNLDLNSISLGKQINEDAVKRISGYDSIDYRPL